jgi:hypothetical protein
MKLRSDSLFNQLTDDQKAQIFDWLQCFGYTETIKRVAAPAPDGFGLKTHRQSLHRFYQRYSQELKPEHLETAVELSKIPHTPELAVGSEQAMHHTAFQLATSPVDIETFKELSRWITKHKAEEHKAAYVRIADQHLALARERLALERAKFEFNAAREALNHHNQLGQILADPHADDEAKIHAARERIFGKENIAHIDAQEKQHHKSE